MRFDILCAEHNVSLTSDNRIELRPPEYDGGTWEFDTGYMFCPIDLDCEEVLIRAITSNGDTLEERSS